VWTSENNWYKWNYGDGPTFGRQQDNKIFTTSFSCGYIDKHSSFKEELINAAKSVIDHYTAKPSILFSGGLDSDIMLRSFLLAGARPNVYIYRYEKDYNIYDVSYAVTICSMLNIDYKIIDFNLEKFFSTDAERLAELAQIDRPRALPYCSFLEQTDGLPILGASDLSIHRTNDNYTTKGSWAVRCWEHDVAWSKFIRTINKPAVGEWFKWTPGLVMSYTKTKWCQKLINDKFPGKLGVNSTKIEGYREAYPDLIDRKKQTGFEYTDHMVLEFEEFLKQKNGGLVYRQFFDRPFESLKTEIQT
jgi:hypothetical protein